MINNEKMKNMLQETEKSNINEKLVKLTLDNIKKLFCPNFIHIYDCIIISDKEIELSVGQYDKVIGMFGDRTGYEASNNDTRINDYFDSGVSGFEALSIAMILIDVWGNKLKALEPDINFCFIVDCNDDYVTLRFHKVRIDERMWLSNNIEDYSGAIGYIIK